MKTVQRSSVFPASRQEVFRLLQDVKTLQYIARPYASFVPADKEREQWQEGETMSFRLRLFCCIPFGTHTIRVIRFRKDGIVTAEGNEHVPVWNHRISLKELPRQKCEYTDHVEIDAGMKTNIVWLWALCFYRHRQKKWIRLLAKG
jgi:hypothetical protein